MKTHLLGLLPGIGGRVQASTMFVKFLGRESLFRKITKLQKRNSKVQRILENGFFVALKCFEMVCIK